jgi:hypothetical protein
MVFIEDANNDGYNDIATANAGSNDISILLWNSTSGDWGPQITKSVGNYPCTVFIGDANNDGYNDIATTNVESNDISILLWNSTLEDWDPQITKAVGGLLDGIYNTIIEDANNDGYNDIVTANFGSNDISIFLWNSTSGDWGPQITKSLGTGPTSVFIGDANNDGYNDIATANLLSNNTSILLWNNISEDWNPPITRSVGYGPLCVFIGDANNDGFTDIITSNAYSDDISILLWKPAYISIISPENKTYGPLKGYYPATYGFDNDVDGVGAKNWWGQAIVESSYNGHNKVVKHINYSWNSIGVEFDNQTSGTIEFYFNTNNTNKDVQFNCFGYNPSGEISRPIILGIYAGYLRRYCSGWQALDIPTPCSINTWYHIRIDFDCDTDTWNTTVNGELRSWDDPFDSGDSIFISDLRFYQFLSPVITRFDAIGFSWDPGYELGDNLNEGMWLTFYNNTHLDWIAYSLDGSDNKTIFEQEIMPLPEDGSHWIQLFGRDAESGEIIESEIRYFSVDTTSPEISIHSPIDGEAFGCMAPKYNISIVEANLESVWYTIDGGITNFTINKLSGFIDQYAWIEAPLGPITISFYAKDILNNTNYEEVIITKAKLLSIDIVNQSFSSSEFRIEFSIYNESSEAIDFASIQMWWNGIDVSADVQNLGSGLYFISLEPIIIAPGEDPILLNMTVSATGYADKYFETYIAVHPSDVVEDTLDLEIVDQSFSEEKFDITFFIHNTIGAGIDFATFQIWWNGVDVSADVQNLGNGYYFISLEPITVVPGEDPIQLSITISATGYVDKYFDIDIAVDPASLQKGEGEPTEEFPLFLIIIISAVSAGVIIGLVSILWLRKRKREPQ